MRSTVLESLVRTSLALALLACSSSHGRSGLDPYATVGSLDDDSSARLCRWINRQYTEEGEVYYEYREPPLYGTREHVRFRPADYPCDLLDDSRTVLEVEECVLENATTLERVEEWEREYELAVDTKCRDGRCDDGSRVPCELVFPECRITG